MTPCVIITRDRASLTVDCLTSLAKYNDQLEFHVVDHGSTWGPMLQLLENFEEDEDFTVHRRGDYGPRSLWGWDGLRAIVGSRQYIVTDPDLELDEGCPDDWLFQMEEALAEGYAKVGLGLRLDDLPSTELAARVKNWEQPFWANSTHGIFQGTLMYHAPVDTTLALYQPLDVAPSFSLAPAVRLGPPYLVRHLPWYGDNDPAETGHYRARLLPGSSHWANGGHGWV
jgi:hypothetical protein